MHGARSCLIKTSIKMPIQSAAMPLCCCCCGRKFAHLRTEMEWWIQYSSLAVKLTVRLLFFHDNFVSCFLLSADKNVNTIRTRNRTVAEIADRTFRLFRYLCCTMKGIATDWKSHGQHAKHGYIPDVESKIVFLWGHFLFSFSDTFAVGYIVWPGHNAQLYWQTGEINYHANSRWYCV